METLNYNSKLRNIDPILVFDDDATGWGNGVKCTQFANLQFEVLTADSANLNVKCYVSYQDEEPTWGDPVTATNRYVPVAILDLDSQNIEEGYDGVTLTGNGLTHYLVGINGARWVNFLVTRTAGEAKIYLNQFNNQ